MAFDCQHCGFRSSEVQMGGSIPEKGVRFELRVEKGDMKARRKTVSYRACLLHSASARPQSLSRQVVKGDTCTVTVRKQPQRATTTRSQGSPDSGAGAGNTQPHAAGYDDNGAHGRSAEPRQP